MTRAKKLIFLVEQDSPANNVAPSALDLANKLLGGLKIKPKIGKAKELPAKEVITIKEVDENEISDEYDIDFTDGGNEAAYPGFVPKGELWIGKSLGLEGKLATISHEFIERLIMLYLGWDYDAAHALCADPVEAVIRWAYRQTQPEKEESFFESKASPEVENWIRTFDESIRKKYHE